jgi:nucleoid-associated protein YgaU
VEELMVVVHGKQGSAVQEMKQSEAPVAKVGLPQAVVRVREPGSSQSETTYSGSTKTVTPGDNLSRLSHEVYGRSGVEVIKLIRQYNPQITNPNVIYPGARILFPDLPVKGEGRTDGRRLAAVPNEH